MNELIADLQTEKRKNHLRAGLPPLQFQRMMTFVLNLRALGKHNEEILEAVKIQFPNSTLSAHALQTCYFKHAKACTFNDEELAIIIAEFNARFYMAIQGAHKQEDWGTLSRINVEFYKFLQSVGILPNVALNKDDVKQNQDSVFINLLLQEVRRKKNERSTTIIDGNVKGATEETRGT